MKSKLLSGFIIINLLVIGMFSAGSIYFQNDDQDSKDSSPENHMPFILFGPAIPITNLTELQNMTGNLSASYYLANDIDCSDTVNWDFGAGFTPVGDVGTAFSGTFDGSGYNITGLFIDRSAEDYIGLFGRIDSSAVIKNVKLTGAVVNGNMYTGGLVGVNEGGIVTASSAEGIINGTDEVGGLMGMNSAGTVSNCESSGNVNGSGDIGGLVGKNDGGTVVNSTSYSNVTGVDLVGGLIGDSANAGVVNNCTAYGSASGDSDIGGLIGYISGGGSVTNSRSYGSVTGLTDYIGGLIGENSGVTVTNCISYSNVMGNKEVGGLIGSLIGGEVFDSTAYGTVTAPSNAGGLVGYSLGGTVINSSAFSSVNGTSAGVYIGGLIGFNDGDVNKCAAFRSVFGFRMVGGLAGYNAGSGIINNTYAAGSVEGTHTTGGHTGNNSGTINYSYARGSVVGSMYTGAFVGNNSNSIFSCFFNNETVGPGQGVGSGNTSGVSGRNTTEMMQQVTFTGAGWDFATAWAILEGKTHPYIGSRYTQPRIITEEIMDIFEDIGINSTIEADYSKQPIENGITWSMNSNASSWLTLSATGRLIGIPTNDELGTYWAEITITDLSGASHTRNFTDIRVLNTNDPPDLNSSATILTATEDVFYNVTYTATDIDPTNDTFIWSIETNASSWLSINPVTGMLSGTPGNADVGMFWVKIIVTDNNAGSTNFTFNLTVINVNDPPVITTTSYSKYAYEDVEYSVDFNAADLDPTSDTISWELNTDADFLVINATSGRVYGTPENVHANKSFIVNVSVEDNHGAKSYLNYTLTVYNTNDDPIITTDNVETAEEDTQYYVDYNAYDIDPTADILTWKVFTDAPFLTIELESGILSGTPGNEHVGSYEVNVTVNDGKFGETFTAFTLSVINVNDPPKITTSDVITALEEELYTVNYDAEDIDPPGDTLTWSLNTDASWLGINTETGVISGTPPEDSAGTYSVNVSVSDGNGGMDFHSFILTVTFHNNNPMIITKDVISITADVLYSVPYNATDDRTPEDDLLWTMQTNANWLTFDVNTALLKGIPSETDIGTYWVYIQVGDGEGGFASRNFTLTVNPKVIPNQAPFLISGTMTPSSGDSETEFTFSVHYHDNDDDPPSSINVVIDGEPHPMTLESGIAFDGDYVYKTKLDSGTHTYYFTASDGSDPAYSGDNTPVTADTAITSPKITKAGESEDEGTNLALIIIPIVIIIVLIVVFIMMRRRSREEAVYTCPECGAIVAFDETTCPECGTEIEEGEELEEEEE